jgi:predicted metallo-beta-lactamase superfamily hydrolase
MNIKIRLIGFDSMGTRGMATVIDTGSIKIFVDPGVSYAPKRYGLPPHPIELELFEKYLNRIYEELMDTDIVIISHYHRDHYLYRNGEEEYYRNKILYIKDPLNNINVSQRIRAYVLLNKMNVKDIARKIYIADSHEYIIDENIQLKFIGPVPHGEKGTKLGSVIMSLITINGYKILHASDVEGPIEYTTRNLIINLDPDILIISGPPTYLMNYRFSKDNILKGLTNLSLIARNMRRNTYLIVDHHLLRDINYIEYLRKYIRGSNARVMTAAEYMGARVFQAEALRKELWLREKNQ